MKDKLLRAWRYIPHIFVGRTPPIVPSDGRPLVPTQPLRPIPRPKESQPDAVGLQICIDFGTSASAVTLAGDEKHDFAILGYVGNVERRTIGSSVLWLNEDNVGEEVLIMGSENYADVLTVGDRHAISRSLKRLLFDYDLLPEGDQNGVRNRLRAILRELLLLAIAPRHSSTIAALRARQGADTVHLDYWSDRGGFGWDAEKIKMKLNMSGQICLCVPNSFGPQSIAVATAALTDALAVISSRHPELGNIVNCSVRLVREAEAIAWAAIQEVRERGRVLIVDVGAGTTDVAVVENSNRLPRLRMRSGIPFGGDDVDQLLLVVAAHQAEVEALQARAAGAASRDVIPVESMNVAQKSTLVGNARRGKEAWSVSQVQGTPSSPAEIPVLFRDSSDPSRSAAETRDVADPHRETLYGKFLNYAISATCAPLLNELRARGLELGSVILSGSSSALPEVRATVQALLGSVQMRNVEIHSIAERLRPFDAFGPASDVQRAKLACAWGAAESTRDWEITRDLRQYVPERITVSHNDREEVLFEAGMAFADGELTRYLPLPLDAPGHILLFRRYFCVPSAFIEEGQRSSSWVRRLIARMKLLPRTCGVGVRLTLSDQAPSFHETLNTWYESTSSPHDMARYDPDVLPQPPGDNERNPVTGLPINWAWFS